LVNFDTPSDEVTALDAFAEILRRDPRKLRPAV
jgi:hypothetical protein